MSGIAESPRIGFFSLPPELRNMIYKLLLVPAVPITIKIHEKSGLCTREGEWPGGHTLLRVNRQMQYEASAMLYGQNEFLIPYGPGTVHSFLTLVGPVNASQILRLSIDLPITDTFDQPDQPGQLKPREEDLVELRLIQEMCPSLQEIYLEIEFIYQDNLRLNSDVEDPFMMVGYFPRINAVLSAMASLHDISVYSTWNIYSEVVEAMEELGWRAVD
ncbi:hypothetical protein F5Y12DRAFT_181530 [Xylaria sp. FL1777]|nr:hypothetical protein F5Y12DRAFT_181530 [Xylaria sp. FL1777]